MDFVSVFPLMLAFLSTGQSNAKVDSDCFEKCPSGYFRLGGCNHQLLKHKCGKCRDGTYTAIENTSSKCHSCVPCGHNEMEVKPCSPESNAVCDCMVGHYDIDPSPKIRICKECPCTDCKKQDKPVCQHCRSVGCLNNSECERRCGETTVTPSTNLPSGTTTFAAKFMNVTATAIRPTASSSTFTPTTYPQEVNHLPWLFLIVISFLGVFWVLLFLIRNPVRYPDRCPFWIAKKDAELPNEDIRLNEQLSHPGNSPPMLTLTISEEAPMMTLGPATPEHQALFPVPALPDAEHKAARQNEQLEHWPAIVLYAIIKEVPLRRWKEFLRLLSVADQQLERVELEAGLGLSSMERQYQMLRLWSQRSTASLNDVFSALHYMDLSGCAQLLQENLEKLKWRPFTDHGLNGAMQDT